LMKRIYSTVKKPFTSGPVRYAATYLLLGVVLFLGWLRSLALGGIARLNPPLSGEDVLEAFQRWQGRQDARCEADAGQADETPARAIKSLESDLRRMSAPNLRYIRETVEDTDVGQRVAAEWHNRHDYIVAEPTPEEDRRRIIRVVVSMPARRTVAFVNVIRGHLIPRGKVQDGDGS